MGLRNSRSAEPYATNFPTHYRNVARQLPHHSSGTASSQASCRHAHLGANAQPAGNSVNWGTVPGIGVSARLSNVGEAANNPCVYGCFGNVSTVRVGPSSKVSLFHFCTISFWHSSLRFLLTPTASSQSAKSSLLPLNCLHEQHHLSSLRLSRRATPLLRCGNQALLRALWLEHRSRRDRARRQEHLSEVHPHRNCGFRTIRLLNCFPR